METSIIIRIMFLSCKQVGNGVNDIKIVLNLIRFPEVSKKCIARPLVFWNVYIFDSNYIPSLHFGKDWWVVIVLACVCVYLYVYVCMLLLNQFRFFLQIKQRDLSLKVSITNWLELKRVKLNSRYYLFDWKCKYFRDKVVCTC